MSGLSLACCGAKAIREKPGRRKFVAQEVVDIATKDVI
jgi:hypothetical protein